MISHKINSKKILIIKNHTIPYTSGSGINMYYFAKELISYDFEVTILTFNWNLKHKYIETLDRLTIFRIPYIRIKVFEILSFILAILIQFLFLLKHETIKLNGIFPGYLWVLFIGKILKKRLIFESTTLNVDDIHSLIKRRIIGSKLRKLILSYMYGYHSINPEFTKIFLDYFADKNIKLLEASQGVNTNQFYPVSPSVKKSLREKLELPLDAIIIISIGNLTLRKGYYKSFEFLSTLNLDFYYYIIGNYQIDSKYYYWQNKKELKELHDYGLKKLNNKIVFLGRKNNVDEYLKSSDVFLLNSEYEGLPNSLLEAMACGIPSLIKSLPGVDNYLAFNGKNSLIHKTELELLKNLNTILLDEKLRNILSQNARKLIENQFSYSNVIPLFIKNFILNHNG